MDPILGSRTESQEPAISLRVCEFIIIWRKVLFFGYLRGCMEYNFLLLRINCIRHNFFNHVGLFHWLWGEESTSNHFLLVLCVFLFKLYLLFVKLSTAKASQQMQTKLCVKSYGSCECYRDACSYRETRKL